MTKILLVDDDKTFLAVLSDWFEGRGFTVTTRTNGPSTLEFLEKEHVDVIILDFMMQPMNGLELLKYIKRETKTKDIPVFMLSQFEEGDHIEEAKKLGAEDYLVKANFNLESLTTRIKNIVSES